MLKLKRFLILTILSFQLLILALVFQNCGDVSLKTHSFDQSSFRENDNHIKGTICHPLPASIVSTHTLSDFFAINLTAAKLNGSLVADSNLDGVIDVSLESPRETVEVSDFESSDDGIPDFVKILKGLNPNRADAEEDMDFDTISNKREIQIGTDPQIKGDLPTVNYSVKVSDEHPANCGEGQMVYSFHVNRMVTVDTKAFEDSVNADILSLSHAEHENVILLLARISPADATESSIYIAKILRLDHRQVVDINLAASDFFILGESLTECPTCGAPPLGKAYEKVFSGGKFACALSTENRPFCWGDNTSGQLGDGSVLPKLAPVPANLNPTLLVKEMALGGSHSCALTTTNKVYCWGGNSFGQLGNDSTIDSLVPVEVNLGENVLMISAGESHTCAVVQSGKIKCWGRNDLYQLGDGSTSHRQLPVLVSNGSPALSFPLKNISSRGNYNCLIDGGGRGYCWGQMGQLTQNQMTALPISNNPPNGNYPTEGFLSGANWTSIVTNGLLAAGLKSKADGLGIICWDWSISQAPLPCGEVPIDEGRRTDDFMIGISKLEKLTLGMRHACAINNAIQSGNIKPSLKCWGENTYGQLGKAIDPDEMSTQVPGIVSQISEPVDITSGYHFSCAIDKGFKIWCWGLNNYGQLGSGNITNSSTPAEVKGQ